MFRRDLHRHPEVSGTEARTASRVASALSVIGGWEVRGGIGGHGVLATRVIDPSGPALLLRADMDALPIQEEGDDRPHRSVHDGVAHLCGHDGHTTMLLAAAERIAEDPPSTGTVHLIFQPAEETGQGARAILADDGFPSGIDRAVALHNIPGVQRGTVVVGPGSFTHAVRSTVYTLIGRTAHAGESANGLHPGPAAGRLLQVLGREASGPGRAVTVVHAVVGDAAYGTAPGRAEVHVTARSTDDADLDALEEELDTTVRTICREAGLSLDLQRREHFAACHNDPDVVEAIRRAARAAGAPVEERRDPFRWGEDFGFFTQHIPGALFGLGAGIDHPSLHTGTYDFPDDLIDPGARILHAIVHETLH